MNAVLVMICVPPCAAHYVERNDLRRGGRVIKRSRGLAASCLVVVERKIETAVILDEKKHKDKDKEGAR